MSVSIDFEGHEITLNNRLNGAVLSIDGKEACRAGGLIHSDLLANLPDGRLVTVKVSSGWLTPHYTVLVDNKVIFTK